MDKNIVAALSKRFGESGFSFRELADNCDITVNTLQFILNRKATNPHIDTLCKLCDALDISISELLCDTTKEKIISINSRSHALLENFENLSAHGQDLLLELSFVFTKVFTQK